MALNHDTHPALKWMWTRMQLDPESRTAFVALVERYEEQAGLGNREIALALLEEIWRQLGQANGPYSWYRAQRTGRLREPLRYVDL
jgi:hypothetical protein